MKEIHRQFAELHLLVSEAYKLALSGKPYYYFAGGPWSEYPADKIFHDEDGVPVVEFQKHMTPMRPEGVAAYLTHVTYAIQKMLEEMNVDPQAILADALAYYKAEGKEEE